MTTSLTNIPIFPTEALILGECFGESIESGDRFIDCFRRRWLSVMPSFIEHKQLEGLGSIKDDSRKSLIDIVLEQLKPSLAQTEFEENLWHHSKFTQLRHYVENLSELATTYGDRKKFEALIRTDQSDNQEELKTSLFEIAQNSEFTGLFELGQLFGKVIAECEYAIDVLVRPYGYKLGDSDDGFTLVTYVTKEDVGKLSNLIQCEFPGLTFTLLQSAGETLELEFPYDEDEWYEMASRALKQVNAVLSALWISMGEILGLVRERDMLARITDARSSIPRSHRLTRSSSLNQAEEALSQAEETLSNVDSGKRSPELVILNLVPVLEIILEQVWPSIGNQTGGLGKALQEKLVRGNSMEKRFAGTARNLHLSYRNPASHGRGQFQCIQAEARFFVSGLRSLLELSKHLTSTNQSLE